MKHLNIVLVILFASISFPLSGCKAEDQTEESAPTTTKTTTTETTTDTTTDTTEPEDREKPESPESKPSPELDEPAIDNPVPPAKKKTPERKPYLLASIGTSEISFFDGQSWSKSAYEKKAGPSTYMIGSEIHILDARGKSKSIIYAPEFGDLIKKVSDGFILCDIIQQDEATQLGARPAVYSQVHRFQNGVWSEPRVWYLQKWTCSKIIETESGDIIVQDSLGRFWPINSSKNVFYASDSGLLIHSYDGQAKTAIFEAENGLTNESWALNYISGSKDWIELQGAYYAYNGYEYSYAGGLLENANDLSKLQIWPYAQLELANGERPTMIPIGGSGSSNVVYWVECNTGWLVEYRIATRQVVTEKRLFVGDRLMLTGLDVRKSLHPVMIGAKIYFNHGGSTQVLNLDSGSVVVFLNGTSTVTGY